MGTWPNPIDIDFALWDRTFAVNARGYLAGCKYTLPHMLERGGGVIIMTSSGSGLFGDISNVAYSASKAAVMSLVRSVATMYGQKNIRCNSVCPGVVRSDGGKENVHGPILEIMRRQTVLPRLGHPDDIAGMTVFLCSDEAGYITGQNIIIDGGAKMKMPYYSEFTHDNIAWGGQ